MDIFEVIKNIPSQLSLSQKGSAKELQVKLTSVYRWKNNKSQLNQLQDTLYRSLSEK